MVELHPTGRFTVEFDVPGVGFDDGKHLILGMEDVEVLVDDEKDGTHS